MDGAAVATLEHMKQIKRLEQKRTFKPAAELGNAGERPTIALHNT
jgi:hypothetical protein